jgi:signal transduction histidine kinase
MTSADPYTAIMASGTAPAWPRRPSVSARAIDGVLAAAALTLGIAGQIAARNDSAVESAPASPVLVGLAVVAAGAVLGRRTRPLTMLAALLGAAIVASAVRDPGLYSLQIGAETMVLFHGVGAWGTARRAGGVAAVGLTLLIAASATAESGAVAAGAFALALVAFPFAVGLAARSRRQYLEAIEERLQRAEAERDEQARRAIAEERSRIARELHDVVAHHVSLIGVQAGAARTALDVDRVATRQALLDIEDSSREAIAEMRRLLDVLHPVEGPGREPVPTLERLDDLAERWTRAGVTIELRLLGDPASLPVDLGSCAYRIVEEALTNVARHSRAGRADVHVAVSATSVDVEVRDPGPAVASVGTVGRGGLGMRERVAIFGGTLSAGPASDGGFVVAAHLPRVRA